MEEGKYTLGEDKTETVGRGRYYINRNIIYK